MKFKFAFIVNNGDMLDSMILLDAINRKMYAIKLPGNPDVEFEFDIIKKDEDKKFSFLNNKDYNAFFVYSEGNHQNPAAFIHFNINNTKAQGKPVIVVNTNYQKAKAALDKDKNYKVILVDVGSLKILAAVVTAQREALATHIVNAPTATVGAFDSKIAQTQPAENLLNNAVQALFVEIAIYTINLLQQKAVPFDELYAAVGADSFRPKQTLTVGLVRTQQIKQYVDGFKSMLDQYKEQSKVKEVRKIFIDELKKLLDRYGNGENVSEQLKAKIEKGETDFTWILSKVPYLGTGNEFAQILGGMLPLPVVSNDLDKAFSVKATPTPASTVRAVALDTKTDAKTAAASSSSSASSATAAAPAHTVKSDVSNMPPKAAVDDAKTVLIHGGVKGVDITAPIYARDLLYCKTVDELCEWLSPVIQKVKSKQSGFSTHLPADSHHAYLLTQGTEHYSKLAIKLKSLEKRLIELKAEPITSRVVGELVQCLPDLKSIGRDSYLATVATNAGLVEGGISDIMNGWIAIEIKKGVSFAEIHSATGFVAIQRAFKNVIGKLEFLHNVLDVMLNTITYNYRKFISDEQILQLKNQKQQLLDGLLRCITESSPSTNGGTISVLQHRIASGLLDKNATYKSHKMPLLTDEQEGLLTNRIQQCAAARDKFKKENPAEYEKSRLETEADKVKFDVALALSAPAVTAAAGTAALAALASGKYTVVIKAPAVAVAVAAPATAPAETAKPRTTLQPKNP